LSEVATEDRVRRMDLLDRALDPLRDHESRPLGITKRRAAHRRLRESRLVPFSSDSRYRESRPGSPQTTRLSALRRSRSRAPAHSTEAPRSSGFAILPMAPPKEVFRATQAKSDRERVPR
jgi:hypothetical protein